MSETSASQITDTVFMVRPASFGFNAETAENNAFQVENNERNMEQIAIDAQEEFDTLVNKLRNAGINVIVGLDDPEPIKPDAVFPNNWISFHQDGSVIFYPMYAENRRIERSQEYVQLINKSHVVDQLISYTDQERQDQFLEGTGSMLLDRVNKIVYACISDRTHPILLEKWARDRGYKIVSFSSTDRDDRPIYHTNVIMVLGEHFAVIAEETIKNQSELEIIRTSLEKTGKQIIPITMDQVYAFAGNMLQVKSIVGVPHIIMSDQAYQSLRADQILDLESHGRLIFSPIYTIETLGGGSVRCMLAEVFLPRR